MLGNKDEKQVGDYLPWPDNYYAVTNMKLRFELLEKAIKEEGDTKENQVRKILFERRYPKFHKDQEIDVFIRFWMDMVYVSKNYKSFFNKKTALKVAKNAIKEAGFSLKEVEKGVGRDVFYQELKHLVHLYLRICTQDRRYTSNLMGMITMKDEKLIAKITNEVYKVSYLTPKAIGLEKDLELFTKAALEAFYEDFPQQKDVMKELMEQEQ